MTTYEVIIGLEIHLRLRTVSKMFCGCRNKESDTPNSVICPICMGHPGTLPMVNREAVRMGSVLALALNCTLTPHTKFDRKNYFYPDLPKGYQISQFDMPLARDGQLMIVVNGKEICIHIERLHLEEDAAKLKHQGDTTLVDFNRAGSPLAEIVTQPDFRSPEEANIFLHELQKIARVLGVSLADMEKGHFRCDANISLRPQGDHTFYPKTEVKNMNSFRSVMHALQYEMQRQTDVWDQHAAPSVTTTRGWDDKRQRTIEQRRKEDLADYRYFPEPDLPPLVRMEEEILQLRNMLPELPHARRIRFCEEYAMNDHDANLLSMDSLIANFFEETVSELRGWWNSVHASEQPNASITEQAHRELVRLATSWTITQLLPTLRDHNTSLEAIKISPLTFAELLELIFEKKVNSQAARKILDHCFRHGGDPHVIMQELHVSQMGDDEEMKEVVRRVCVEHADAVFDVRSGKEKAMMFLVGQLMKETKGRINPERAMELLRLQISNTSDLV